MVPQKRPRFDSSVLLLAADNLTGLTGLKLNQPEVLVSPTADESTFGRWENQ